MRSVLNSVSAIFSRTGLHVLVLVACVLVSTHAAAQTNITPEWLPALLEKDSITIVITDSGLGGLSVVADAVEKFQQ